ncbi:pyridoxal-phosphate dependent enzyme [Clostridium tagluense]|uniref:pyridoxal-phosphate dependent enzyme n=1 Tax=Clostridium TaxID=1485 RepID=UPI0013E9529B|nr:MULTISPECIES: pyridoxal-phosphate dependent enzyme [Clostridium]MBW9158524.1 pyridoxal-phosphate dependent enzyme [Clostridium tagluense]MBZ9622253.1 pyridoxal-phosphate dependent enzyme [Clostridium sp. FP2]MCB2310323.1 pyridoxal-phosphate dependent enzyme [Clostridium tagluense]MCB2315035.1 pyridoxal-phosphate dependent enzyme [Clostridium tagluense]MCB2320023.1 pyridoxal-phosphate dependent enzyme [Clostridium tagluense]
MKNLIDLTINEEQLKKTVQSAKERNVVIPTFAQMKDPSKIPAEIKEKLKTTGLWDIDPVNLFRISWKNQPVKQGGLYNELPNYIEIPPEISGVKARIFAMVGKYFPVGCHKVGASFACLVPRLVTGQFDPTYHEAVWPSTGNYCRGGAYNSALLGCKAVAILPENMSKERFDWLSKVAGEVIATPGCESNVKEIYDKTWELRETRDNVVIFNQFGELGNHLWHYEVTGNAMNDIVKAEAGENGRLAGVCLTSGSAGTLGSGDFLKDQYPNAKIAVGEALQCPTLLNNGFGDHRIEGIGDKHIPWIHNVRNTDMVVAIDDNDALAMFKLFNEPAGKAYLKQQGISEELISKLSYVGISGAANILTCIKFAKYYELTENDMVMTVLTDSAEMYGSRLAEMQTERGRDYSEVDAAIDHNRSVLGVRTDSMEELTYQGKKRIHNLKYYTWIEQQKYDLDELNAQWYDYDNYWGKLHQMGPELDKLIEQFNERTGIIKTK